MQDAFFDGQRDGERVLFVWRRNPATMLKQGILSVASILLVILSVRYVGFSLLTSVLLGLWILVIPAYIGIVWFRWWNDLYILTNQRLVDVDQKNLFHRAVAEAALENIQDVAFETKGLLQTFLNYGTVVVQTASVTTEIDIQGVTDPQAVQQTILRTVAQVRSNNRTPNESPRAQIESQSSHQRTQLG